MRAIDGDAFDERVRAAGGMSEEELTEDFKDGVQAVLYMLSKQPTIQPEPHWIPVTERLPEVGKSVMICDAYGDICIGHRTRSGYYFPDFCDDKIKDVRAWMPLPEPFKGVTE